MPVNPHHRDIWIQATIDTTSNPHDCYATITTLHHTHVSFITPRTQVTELDGRVFVKVGLLYKNRYDYTALILLPEGAVQTNERWVEVQLPTWGDASYPHHAMLNPQPMEM